MMLRHIIKPVSLSGRLAHRLPRLGWYAWMLTTVCSAALSARLSADTPTELESPAVAITNTVRPGAAGQGAGSELVLRFRREPRCQTQVVRVGDLVEVAGGNGRGDDDLLEVPLAPAPKVGSSQQWNAHDVLRHLELRGLVHGKIRWSGAESVTLLRVADVATNIDRTRIEPAFVQDRILAQAEANVAQATREYLWLKTGERTEWRVRATIPTAYAQALSQRRNIQTIGGGAAPWVGQQELSIGCKHSGTTFQITVPVLIELPQTVVVTTRPMRRDEVIEEDALAYAPLPERMAEQADEYFTDFSQVVGKQLRRSLSTGLPVPGSAVGEPIVVSSGELIEVESVAGSISVKTAGRALSGGAVGDLINVELLSSRKRLSATVVGPLQVRIAGGAAVSTSPLATPAPASKARNQPPRGTANLSQAGQRR